MGQRPDASISLTTLLQAWQKGDGAAQAALFELAYAELKRIAASRLAHSGAATLTPTELLHESALRVLDGAVTWQNRAHFLASMSLYMRAVLLDHARARASEKRGGGLLRVSLSHVAIGEESAIADLLALDRALSQLEELDPRSSGVLHLSCFAGLDRHQIAEVLKVSVQVVDRELRFAKTWLNAHLDTRL